jgi:hypothetical protein
MAFGSMCVAVNPWLSIWTQPRRTIRYVLDTDSDPDGVSLAIAVFYMLTQLLYSLFDGEGPGGTNAGIIVGTLIASAICVWRCALIHIRRCRALVWSAA